jgi:putative RecB family exonuclease
MALPLPSTLTPSKLGKFVSCPLSFRYSYIDHIPEPATIYQVRGTLVHRALQVLFSDTAAGERTEEAAAAALDAAWAEVESSPDVTGLGLDEGATRTFLREAAALVAHYFSLEDPTAVHAVGLELDLRAPFGNVELRGIIDRVDRLANGDLVVIDYKTGRAPRPEQSRGRLAGVQFYAFLCQQVLGARPSEIRLMYLKDRVVIVESPTDQSMRGLQQRARAVWSAIERACESEDFRPNPTPLCKSCAYQSLCPAFTARSAEPETITLGERRRVAVAV